MTPRQMAGLLYFVAARKKREAAMMLSVNALAASGDNRAVKKQLTEFEKD